MSRVIGGALLLSVLIWWSGLQWWAAARFGHLDVDGLGLTPMLWELLIGTTGLVLAGGLLRGRRSAAAAVAMAFVVGVVVLVIPNIGANIDDGISAAGWLVAVGSAAQVLAALIGVVAAAAPGHGPSSARQVAAVADGASAESATSRRCRSLGALPETADTLVGRSAYRLVADEDQPPVSAGRRRHTVTDEAPARTTKPVSDRIAVTEAGD